MFYGMYPPWASVLIYVSVAAFVACVICLVIACARSYYYDGTWRLYPIAAALLVIGGVSTTFASIQAYQSQVALYNLSAEQRIGHVDSIDGVWGTMSAYNSIGNCFVHAKYDPYQKALVLDASKLRNSTISLNGTTVYKLTTKPLSQEGINQLCEASYGVDAFNNTKDD